MVSKPGVKGAWSESGSHETRDMMRAQDMEDPAGHSTDARWEAMEGL